MRPTFVDRKSRCRKQALRAYCTALLLNANSIRPYLETWAEVRMEWIPPWGVPTAQRGKERNVLLTCSEVTNTHNIVVAKKVLWRIPLIPRSEGMSTKRIIATRVTMSSADDRLLHTAELGSSRRSQVVTVMSAAMVRNVSQAAIAWKSSSVTPQRNIRCSPVTKIPANTPPMP